MANKCFLSYNTFNFTITKKKFTVCGASSKVQRKLVIIIKSYYSNGIEQPTLIQPMICLVCYGKLIHTYRPIRIEVGLWVLKVLWVNVQELLNVLCAVSMRLNIMTMKPYPGVANFKVRIIMERISFTWVICRNGILRITMSVPFIALSSD